MKTPSYIPFLWNSNTNLPRVYLSEIPNFIMIGYKRAEIQVRKLTDYCEEKMDIRSLWPWPSTQGHLFLQGSSQCRKQQFSENRVQTGASVRLEFWISWRCKKRSVHRLQVLLRLKPTTLPLTIRASKSITALSSNIFYRYSLEDCGSSKLNLSVCLSVCLSHYYGWSIDNYGLSFDETWLKYWNIGPIHCKKVP